MNENKLFAAAADLDDRFVAETMQKKARPRGVRFIAAATAALILVGAGFAAYKALVPDLGKADENTRQEADTSVNGGAKYAFLADTSVPADAVLPPVQEGGDVADAMYLRSYDIAELYSASKAVCLVSIRNWLGENEAGTYFEADVERVYKGDLPDTIVLFQQGNSNYQMEGSPLYTYGDKLLVGLTPWTHSTYANAYDIVGTDIAMMYAAVSQDGEAYLFDHRGLLSYNTERDVKEHTFANYADDNALVDELLDFMDAYDPAICSELRRYYHSSAAGGTMPLHIYSLDEMEAFFTEIGQN